MLENRKRLAITLIVACVGLVGLHYLRLYLLPMPLDRCTSRRFDGNVWRDSIRAYSDAAPRGCMVDDLLAHTQFRGKTRADVVALLGEPRPTSYFKDYDLVYWLGPERGLMSVDSEWLVMRLDRNGRVAEQKLVTD
jgi:outer membrane protein assembly factor BamE (lipoprotein component of BamABCDE complex)